ncbi:MAG: SatD family protein [Pseudomonadota bacterium]
MDTYAVLTGDIVKSREISPRARLIRTLKEALAIASQAHRADYEIYRGDSFQMVIPSPSAAALVAIVIRSKLLSQSAKKSSPWDARISVGIGGITYRGEKTTESDGPAFLLSGQGMDELNKTNRRLIVKAPWDAADRSLSLVTRFADDIVSNWSRYSAETAFLNLVYEESQNALAKRLGKSQSTINDRIATAKLELIRAYVQHVKDYVNWETRA